MLYLIWFVSILGAAVACAVVAYLIEQWENF